jgi:hypothetical protein
VKNPSTYALLLESPSTYALLLESLTLSILSLLDNFGKETKHLEISYLFDIYLIGSNIGENLKNMLFLISSSED